MKRYLFELTAYLPNGVERRSHVVSDEWIAAELARDPNPDRIVEFEPDYHPLGEPPVMHIITAVGFDPI